MSKQTIDLRKKRETSQTGVMLASEVQYRGIHPQSQKEKSTAEVRNVHGDDIIEWSCLEHERRVRGPYWFLFPLAGATLAMIYSIVTANYLFLIFVVIAFITVMLYARKAPKLIWFSISPKGIGVEQKLYPYAKLKSFTIFEHLAVPEVSFETESYLMPHVSLPLGEVRPSSIREALIHYLPEQKREEPATDQIARMLGF